MPSNELLASKVVVQEESPDLHQIPGRQTAVFGCAVVTEKGPFGATLVQSFDEYGRIYGRDVAAGHGAETVRGFFAEAGSGQVYVSRVVHCSDVTDPTTKTSLAATLALLSASASATAASVTSGNVGPYAMTPGQTLKVAIDAAVGVSTATATFNAAAAARTAGGGTYSLADGQTLTVVVDGGPVQTVTFHTSEFVSISAATDAEVRDVLAAALTGVSVDLNGGKVRITTDKQGLGASLNVTGGSANAALGFTTGALAGTGNVQDITAVTATEVATIGQGAVSGSAWSVVGGAVKIASLTTGTSSKVQVDASSTATSVGFDNAIHLGSSGTPATTLTVNGKYDGAYGNALSVKVAAASSGDATRFNLAVIRGGLIIETFVNLSMSPSDSRYALTIVNAKTNGSAYIALVDPAAGLVPALGTFGPLTGGSDGLASLDDNDFLGGSGTNGKTGLRALDTVADLGLVAVPGRTTPAIHLGLITYCQSTRLGSCFALLDPPPGSSATDIVTYVTTTAALVDLSEFGEMHWPWVKVPNPNKAVFTSDDDGNITIPPAGIVAGVYARTDNAREGGVYDPPAGIEKGVLLSVTGFETPEALDEDKLDLVYPARVNPLTALPGGPRYIDGNRTLKGDGDFPSIAERRGVIFIEQSIKAGLQFARHKNNDETLRASVTRTVDSFLTVQMNLGAFRSRDPKTAFYSDFGDGLNPPAVAFANKLIGRIGLATQKPIDWVILRFSQDTRAFDTAAAANA